MAPTAAAAPTAAIASRCPSNRPSSSSVRRRPSRRRFTTLSWPAAGGGNLCDDRVMDLAERLGLERPVVQAGMGGGLAGARLAAAVSGAGGLGTVGLTPDARAFAAQLRRARELAPGRPLA